LGVAWYCLECSEGSPNCWSQFRRARAAIAAGLLSFTADGIPIPQSAPCGLPVGRLDYVRTSDRGLGRLLVDVLLPEIFIADGFAIGDFLQMYSRRTLSKSRLASGSLLKLWLQTYQVGKNELGNAAYIAASHRHTTASLTIRSDFLDCVHAK